jgi:N-methylhydantoinase A
MTDIVDNQMAQALRLVSVDRGHDPRRFSIMAFGGAGPLAAANLARLLGCKRVIVPIFPGAFSALGCLIAEPRFDYRRTRIMRSDAIDSDVVEAVFADLAAQGRHDFAREGNPEPPLIARSVEMRYAGQNWELEVPIDDQKPMAQAINDARACFEAAHKKRFGWHMEGSAFELVHFKASATSPRRKFELPKLERGKMPKPASFRSVVFPGRPGWVEAAVYRRQDLPADGRIDGPAVIRELASTTLVPPGAHVDLDIYGNMIMTIG